eukprot:3414030-Rhodomonas_salina.3
METLICRRFQSVQDFVVRVWGFRLTVGVGTGIRGVNGRAERRGVSPLRLRRTFLSLIQPLDPQVVRQLDTRKKKTRKFPQQRQLQHQPREGTKRGKTVPKEVGARYPVVKGRGGRGWAAAPGASVVLVVAELVQEASSRVAATRNHDEGLLCEDDCSTRDGDERLSKDDCRTRRDD